MRKLPVLRKRELNQLLPDEKRKRVTELRAELARLRTSVKSGGTVENPARIRELRRTIARLLTSLKQSGETPVSVSRQGVEA